MQPDNQLKNYKAVVVVKMLEGSGGGGVFVATTVVSGVVGGPDLQTQLFVESNWCKMRCYQPGGGAGTGVFSLQTNPTKNKINPTINLSVLVHQTTRQPTENTKS